MSERDGSGLAQQSTFAPNRNFRWWASLAMIVGDIAWDIRSAAQSIRRCASQGRLVSDPASTMGKGKFSA